MATRVCSEQEKRPRILLWLPIHTVKGGAPVNANTRQVEGMFVLYFEVGASGSFRVNVSARVSLGARHSFRRTQPRIRLWWAYGWNGWLTSG